jgi:TonB family protein
MRRSIIFRAALASCAVLLLDATVLPQKRSPVSPVPDQFVIARHTFVDFGPPLDFYELFIAYSEAAGTSVERISVTPPVDVCFAPAKTEVASATLSETPAELLGSTNPCTIPEKELRRELKRCKNCSVFSGAQVVMQVQCSSNVRLIRSNILDKDMFDKAPNTPEHSSWTMRLLQRLDSAVGPSVFEKQRIFTIPESDNAFTTAPDSAALRDLAAGQYDGLFLGARDKPSELYRASQIPPPTPTIRLISSVPFQPEYFVEPIYPPLARVAHVQGTVSFRLTIDDSGSTTDVTFESGPPLLRGAATEAVKKWRFPPNSAGQQIEATMEFDLNCPKTK